MSSHMNFLLPTISIMILLVLSCDGPVGGSVRTLSVLPSHVCRGETVRITWDAQGDVSFAANPSASVRFDMTSGLPSQGSMSATIEDDRDTNIIATASLPEGSNSNTVLVDVIQFEQGQDIEVAGDCIGAVPTWNANVPPSEWSDRILVEQVWNMNTVDITVTHAGARDEILAGEIMREPFKGTTYEGGWSLGTDLPLPNPCGSVGGGGAPDPLTIHVKLYCE